MLFCSGIRFASSLLGLSALMKADTAEHVNRMVLKTGHIDPTAAKRESSPKYAV